MSRKIRGAVFDIDGTLLDSMKIWNDAGERYLKTCGKKAEDGLADILFEMSMEEGAQYMKDRYGLEKTIEEISSGVLAAVEGFYRNEAELKPGAQELLEAFASRGIRMTVATSSDRRHIEGALHRLGILKYFSRVFTCSEVGAGKSSPLIFHAAMDEMGTEPGETCVIEDGLYAVETAKKAGLMTVGVYDSASDSDWDKLRETADVWLCSLEEQNKIWEFVSV